MKTTVFLSLFFVALTSNAQVNNGPECGIKDPIEATDAGSTLEKFSQVAPGIFRGSRPSLPEDFEVLKAVGVKTIVSLESMPWNVGAEADKVQGKFDFINIGIVASPFEPDESQVSKAVAILMDPSVKKPIYIHCAIGRDRTSLIIGLYRIGGENCSPASAWKEMKAFGFNEGIHLRGLKTSFKKQSGYNPDSN